MSKHTISSGGKQRIKSSLYVCGLTCDGINWQKLTAAVSWCLISMKTFLVHGNLRVRLKDLKRVWPEIDSVSSTSSSEHQWIRACRPLSFHLRLFLVDLWLRSFCFGPKGSLWVSLLTFSFSVNNWSAFIQPQLQEWNPIQGLQRARRKRRRRCSQRQWFYTSSQGLNNSE